jgi:hypothetical protein
LPGTRVLPLVCSRVCPVPGYFTFVCPVSCIRSASEKNFSWVPGYFAFVCPVSGYFHGYPGTSHSFTPGYPGTSHSFAPVFARYPGTSISLRLCLPGYQKHFVHGCRGTSISLPGTRLLLLVCDWVTPRQSLVLAQCSTLQPSQHSTGLPSHPTCFCVYYMHDTAYVLTYVYHDTVQLAPVSM